MPINLYADECVHKTIVTALRENAYSVDYISEMNPGLSDHEIVKMVSKNSAILITEDSDYGEWVFVHGYKNIGVVFLRYNASEINQIVEALIKIIAKYKDTLYKKFVVITPQKIRIREI